MLEEVVVDREVALLCDEGDREEDEVEVEEGLLVLDRLVVVNVEDWDELVALELLLCVDELDRVVAVELWL